MFPGERVPDKIGAYSVTKYVGQSGSADVYIARMDGPLGFQRTVTLKMVRYAMEDDARFAEELAREAAICARLNHPAVVRMFDFFEHERRIVLVLEQIEGASLEKLLAHLTRRKQKLADNAILTIGYQIASALAHAHAATDDDGNATPVIHRNVQPENVLVSWDGHVRLSGFGLGKILGRTPDSIAGTVSGTPGFMSPEQARGERATVRSDVYGLGMLLWTLFTDREPPPNAARPDSLVELRPDIPREITAAIDAALEPSPDRRRISCNDIAQWLSKVMNSEKGREELRQKVLALRASRSPVGEVTDSGRTLVARSNARPRRRQTLGAARNSTRRSASVASSFPAPPPSSRAPGPSSRAPSSRAPSSEVPSSRSPSHGAMMRGSARPHSEPPDSSKTLRIPPPPALPQDTRRSYRSNGSHAPRAGSQAPSSPASEAPAASARSGSEIPGLEGETGLRARSALTRTSPSMEAPTSGSLRPSSPPRSASVRPVSVVPPPRSQPPSFGLHLPLVPPASLQPGFADPQHVNGRNGSHHPQAYDAAGGPTLEPVDLRVLNGGPIPQRLDRDEYRVRGRERPLTPVQQVLLTALTAAVVVALGLFFLQRGTAQPQTAHAQTAPPTSTARASAPPKSDVASTASNAGKDGGNDRATPAAETKTQGPDASVLSEKLAYLTVKGPAEADVYINGMRKGPTNQPLVVPCGRWFLRLAPPNPGRFPSWLGKGETVLVPCQQSTVLTVNVDDGTEEPAPRGAHPTYGL